MFGSSETLATKLNQVFVITVNGADVFFNQNGSIVGTPFPVQPTELTVQPTEAIGLVQQERVHKHWKITGVTYKFYKDALSSNNGAVATANYQGTFDGRHSKAVYDSINQPAPNSINSYSGQFDQWITQQKGRLLNTLNGKKCNIYCPARINRQEFLLAANGGYTPVDNLIKFPWLNESIFSDEGQGFRTGQLTCYIPIIRINPLLANTFNVDTSAGRSQLAQKFQWYVRPVIHWAVKGKYYDNVLAQPIPDLMKDLKLSDSEPEEGKDVCGNMSS